VESRIGKTIKGKYRVDRVVGEGGMGVVLAARNERLGREVAIKLLLPQLTRHPEIVARFLHEGRVVAGLRHPHVVDVLDVDTDDDGTPFLVLELLDGEPLSSLLHRERLLTIAEAYAILVPVMDGIALAHERGIVHRDLKPENVFLHHDVRGARIPKVLDFGIARAADAEDRRTSSAATLGTPLYMAPEQIRSARDATPASDVWSMGVLWCEVLSGERPHAIARGSSAYQVMTEIVTTSPRSLGELAPELDPALVAVIDRAVSPDLARRYPDMRAFALALPPLGELGARSRRPAARAPHRAEALHRSEAGRGARTDAASVATAGATIVTAAEATPRRRGTIAAALLGAGVVAIAIALLSTRTGAREVADAVPPTTSPAPPGPSTVEVGAPLSPRVSPRGGAPARPLEQIVDDLRPTDVADRFVWITASRRAQLHCDEHAAEAGRRAATRFATGRARCTLDECRLPDRDGSLDPRLFAEPVAPYGAPRGARLIAFWNGPLGEADRASIDRWRRDLDCGEIVSF
jgi:tRNA A-37 threonylcarbamoyl transferase component Bud32